MVIIGLGIDIEDISRFENMPFDKNINFYKKLFSEKEIDYCLKKSNPYRHFTARFCAKEAFTKASTKSIKNFKDIEIIVENSKPRIITSHEKEKQIHISLSHSQEKAIAIVIIEELK